MARVHILVDSIAQCPPELFAQHDNLYKVPLIVALGGQEWREDERAWRPEIAIVHRTLTADWHTQSFRAKPVLPR